MKKNVFLLCLFLAIAGSIQAVVRPRQNSAPSYSPMQTTEEKNIVCASYETSSDDGTSVVMYSDDEVWQVRFQFSANSLEDNKEYTYSDLVDYQSFIREVGTWNFYSYSAVSYKQWTESNGAFHVRATATTTDGQVWNITYDKGSTQPTGDTITLNFTQQEVSLTDYIQLDETFQFLGKNSSAEIRITISSAQIEGTYSWSDFISLYSGIYLFGAAGDTTLVTFTDIQATVTAIAGKTNAYTCDFVGVATDGHVYKTLLTYIPSEIEAEDEEDIIADNLQVLNFIEKEHLVIFNASTDVYGVSITVKTDTLGGTWGIDDIDSFWSDISVWGDDGLASAMYQIKNAEITFTEDENGNQQLTGWVLASNKMKYNLTLTYTKPTKTREETLSVPNARLKDMSQIAGEEYVRVQGTTQDGKYFVSIMLETNAVAGTYTTDAFDKDYTYVDLLTATGDIEASYSLLDGDLQISLADNTYTVSGTLLMQNGEDVPAFTIDMTATLQTGLDYDVESESLEVNMEYVQTKEYNDENGHYILLAAYENNTAPEHMLFLQFMVDNTDADIMIPVGEYDINDTYEVNTVVACEGVVGGSVLPSFACEITPEGQCLLPMWFLRSGKVSVSKNANNEIHVEVDARNSYDQSVKIVVDPSLSSDIRETELQAQPKKRIVNGQLLIEVNGKTYTVLGL